MALHEAVNRSRARRTRTIPDWRCSLDDIRSAPSSNACKTRRAMGQFLGHFGRPHAQRAEEQLGLKQALRSITN